MRTFLAGLVSVLLTLSQTHAQAQGQADSPNAVNIPIEQLGSEYHNGIKLLQNRFRIDHKVSEITMIFFREYGSAPVVLVRPDGSKLFLSRVTEDEADWYDSDTFDMITIKNPVPGPWQAVGQILEDSRIMVVSDIELHADPLPSMLFAGEILKQTAYVTNGGERIDYGPFADVVELEIEFLSTNNPNHANFGADNQLVATFKDNGQDMDERPKDGVFTGQFNLSVAPGEWLPKFVVATPMYTREQVDEPILLFENPVQIDVDLKKEKEKYHRLLVDVNRELVDISTLLLDGKIRFPNGDIQNFSITELSDDVRVHRFGAFEDGIFRVKLTAYGKTTTGRDFILDVPEYSFNVSPPEPEVDEMPVETMVEEAPSEPDVMEEVDEGMSQESLVLLLVAINGGIILLGGIGIGVVIFLRKRKATLASVSDEKSNGSSSESLDMGENPSFMDKITGLFKRKPKADDIATQ